MALSKSTIPSSFPLAIPSVPNSKVNLNFIIMTLCFQPSFIHPLADFFLIPFFFACVKNIERIASLHGHSKIPKFITHSISRNGTSSLESDVPFPRDYDELLQQVNVSSLLALVLINFCKYILEYIVCNCCWKIQKDAFHESLL